MAQYQGAPSRRAKELERQYRAYLATGWRCERNLETLPEPRSVERVLLHRIARLNEGASLSWRQIFDIAAFEQKGQRFRKFLCNLCDRLEIAFIEIVERNIELAAVEAKKHLRNAVGRIIARRRAFLKSRHNWCSVCDPWRRESFIGWPTNALGDVDADAIAISIFLSLKNNITRTSWMELWWIPIGCASLSNFFCGRASLPKEIGETAESIRIKKTST
jgi:hypothetical protein